MKNKILLLLVPFLSSTMILSGCGKDDFEFKEMKIAVFADNQLTKTNVGGIVEFNGVYLTQHLKLAKEQNVDAIMISGDLVNNAITGYYDRYKDILQSVYGTDESTYPEFIYTMGNHEWYQISEAEEPLAIKYFKKYARIKTDNLVKTSQYVVPGQNETSANYYKVINGIPFLSISGSNSSGILSYSERNEIKDWLKEISQLPSVKKGGPIFCSYHYAIKDVTYTYGQGANANSEPLNAILKDYPQVVLFTGDTHFSGINERTINQVDYTAINIGSSTYTRTIARSVTMNPDETFYNVNGGNSSKDTIDGDVGKNINKTPHIHIVNVTNTGDIVINRYFSTVDPTNPTHLGLEWTIPNNVSKETFKYTNERFTNPEWAKMMYGQEGLSWKEEDKVVAEKISDGLRVSFPDVIDYHWCENFKVVVTGDNKEYPSSYSFVNNYFKYLSEPSSYSFVIKNEDLPLGSSYSVEVIAHDFFDNPSINTLKA